jgi:hypothetical protein
MLSKTILALCAVPVRFMGWFGQALFSLFPFPLYWQDTCASITSFLFSSSDTGLHGMRCSALGGCQVTLVIRLVHIIQVHVPW